MVRKTNEDSYVCLLPHLLLVADGMGGHLAGEVASKCAAKIISDYIVINQHLLAPQVLLTNAIEMANKEIYQMAQNNLDYLGMGTTVTTALIDNNTIYWGHVGDSRLYLIHDNTMTQLTEDHSLVGEMLRLGNITKEEAEIHPNRNILTRAVGTDQQIKVDIGFSNWSEGDGILLCTDGLTTMVSEQDILAYVIQEPSKGAKILEDMFAQANKAGGYDNITAILAYFGDQL